MQAVDEAEQLYHVAEMHRLFKCDSLNRVSTRIDSYLASAMSPHVDELYYGSLINELAEKYGAKPSKDFSKHLLEKTKNSVSAKFNKTTLGYDSLGLSA